MIAFGPLWGLWQLMNATTWIPLHGFSAQYLVLADLDGLGRDEVIVDFGAPHGVWMYSTVTKAWQLLRSTSVEGLLTGTHH